jgi:hypothetical protein
MAFNPKLRRGSVQIWTITLWIAGEEHEPSTMLLPVVKTTREKRNLKARDVEKLALLFETRDKGALH